MNRTITAIPALAALLIAVILLAGCVEKPNRLTRENYGKIEFGMTFEEATEILGEPRYLSVKFGVKQYTWVEGKEGERHVHIKFAANRAIYYSSKGLEAEGA